jgi:hypothetical protein
MTEQAEQNTAKKPRRYETFKPSMTSVPLVTRRYCELLKQWSF